MGSSKLKVANRAHPLFIIPRLSLRRRGRRRGCCRYGCCLEKAKGGEEREKNFLTRELLSPWQPSQHQLL